MNTSTTLKDLFFTLTQTSLTDHFGDVAGGTCAWDLRSDPLAVQLKRRYTFATESEARTFESRVRLWTRDAPLFVIAQKLAGCPKVCIVLRFQPQRKDMLCVAKVVCDCEGFYQKNFGFYLTAFAVSSPNTLTNWHEKR